MKTSVSKNEWMLVPTLNLQGVKYAHISKRIFRGIFITINMFFTIFASSTWSHRRAAGPESPITTALHRIWGTARGRRVKTKLLLSFCVPRELNHSAVQQFAILVFQRTQIKSRSDNRLSWLRSLVVSSLDVSTTTASYDILTIHEHLPIFYRYLKPFSSSSAPNDSM
jgi:hypothetical protein